MEKINEERPQNNLGVVYCGVEVQTPKGDTIGYSEPQNKGKLSKAIRKEGASTLSSTFLFRREALETVGGFDELLPSSVDHDIWMELATHGYHAITLDEPLVINYDESEVTMMTDTSPRIYDVRRYVEKWRPTYREWFGPKEGDTYAEKYYVDVIGRLAVSKVQTLSLFEAAQAMCAMFGYCSNRWYVARVLFWRIVVPNLIKRLPDPFVSVLRTLYSISEKTNTDVYSFTPLIYHDDQIYNGENKNS